MLFEKQLKGKKILFPRGKPRSGSFLKDGIDSAGGLLVGLRKGHGELPSMNNRKRQFLCPLGKQTASGNSNGSFYG